MAVTYAALNGEATSECADAVLTMRPHLRAFMPGTTARIAWKAAESPIAMRMNAEHSRVEMHLVSTAQQRVRVRDASIDVTFEPDEPIWTESSYKYEPDGIVNVLERAGFRGVAQWVDEDARFAVTLVEAA